MLVFPELFLKNAKKPLTIPTFDGSGQAIHQDIVKLKGKNIQYVLAFTPYPFSNELYERPSILISQDGVSWFENGIKNPVINPKHSDELTSDPDIAYANGYFYLYYISWRWGGTLFKKARALLKQYTKQYFSAVNLVMSKDLKKWSKPIQLFKSGGISSFSPFTRLIISPSITWDGMFRMWYVKSFGCLNSDSRVYYRESHDGIRWSKEKKVYLQFPQEEVLWHIDVEKLCNNYYWMIIAAYPKNKHCGKIKNLYLAVSGDGLNWKTIKKPILTTSFNDSWDSDSLYRSTFIVENKTLHLWYSGLRKGVWKIGYTSAKISSLDENVHSFNVVETSDESPSIH